MLTQTRSNEKFWIAGAAYLVRSRNHIPQVIEVKNDRANDVERLRCVPALSRYSGVRAGGSVGNASFLSNPDKDSISSKIN